MFKHEWMGFIVYPFYSCTLVQVIQKSFFYDFSDLFGEQYWIAEVWTIC